MVEEKVPLMQRTSFYLERSSSAGRPGPALLFHRAEKARRAVPSSSLVKIFFCSVSGRSVVVVGGVSVSLSFLLDVFDCMQW